MWPLRQQYRNSEDLRDGGKNNKGEKTAMTDVTKEEIKESEKKVREGKWMNRRWSWVLSRQSEAGRWVVDSLCGFQPWGQSSRGECRGAHLDPYKKERPKLLETSVAAIMPAALRWTCWDDTTPGLAEQKGGRGRAVQSRLRAQTSWRLKDNRQTHRDRGQTEVRQRTGTVREQRMVSFCSLH